MNSMTGYGAARLDHNGRAYRVEIKCLNSRFLDVRVRTPWSAAEVDGRMAEVARRTLARGRVEVNVHEEGEGQGRGGRLRLDPAAARDLGRILAELSRLLRVDAGVAARLIPPQRELVTSAAVDADAGALLLDLEPALVEALAQVCRMRSREGRAHEDALRRQAESLEALRQKVAAASAEEPARLRARLADRLAALTVGAQQVDPTRLAQEAAMLAERSDITEELERLESHLAQLDQLLNEEAAVGRRIDFLIQELHRELSTIGSKTQRVEVSHLALEAKGVVEKMRELVQNVE